MSDCSKGDIEMKLLVVEDVRAEHGADATAWSAAVAADLDEETRLIVSQIETQTEKLNFLIASLVKTSRLENGIIAVAPKQNCVGELLRQLDHAYAAGAGHADGLTKTALTEACRTRILALGQPDQAE